MPTSMSDPAVAEFDPEGILMTNHSSVTVGEGKWA